MSTLDFLNSLGAGERLHFYQVMRSHVKGKGGKGGEISIVQPGTVSGVTLEELGLLQDARGAGRDGQFWLNRLRCHSFTGLTADRLGHLRWQPRLVGCRVDLASSEASVGSMLLGGLSNESRKNASMLPDQLKIFTHHIAYLAHHGDLPGNLGKGSSIDHVCGQKACHRPEHLGVAVRHRDNTARINCDGVNLLVAARALIVQEFPCQHGNGDNMDERILNSCCKIRVLHMDAFAFQLVSQAEAGPATKKRKRAEASQNMLASSSTVVKRDGKYDP